MPKIDNFVHFSSSSPLEKIFRQNLVMAFENLVMTVENMTLYWKKKKKEFQKIFYHKSRITLSSKASISFYSNCPCSSLFDFFCFNSVNFEKWKLQSFRKCRTWYTFSFWVGQKTWWEYREKGYKGDTNPLI